MSAAKVRRYYCTQNARMAAAFQAAAWLPPVRPSCPAPCYLLWAVAARSGPLPHDLLLLPPAPVMQCVRCADFGEACTACGAFGCTACAAPAFPALNLATGRVECTTCKAKFGGACAECSAERCLQVSKRNQTMVSCPRCWQLRSCMNARSGQVGFQLGSSWLIFNAAAGHLAACLAPAGLTAPALAPSPRSAPGGSYPAARAACHAAARSCGARPAARGGALPAVQRAEPGLTTPWGWSPARGNSHDRSGSSGGSGSADGSDDRISSSGSGAAGLAA